MLAVLMPEDEAELLSDIRYIDEHGNESLLRSRGRPTNRGLSLPATK